MADDAGLEAIRQKRLAELQKQHGDFQGNPQAAQEQQQERRRQEEELKESILSQCLDQAARARLATVKAVKPDKAAMAENMLIQMAQRGAFPAKMTEELLKNLLENISERTQKPKTTVKFDRRRANLDDSDEDY